MQRICIESFPEIKLTTVCIHEVDAFTAGIIVVVVVRLGEGEDR